VTVFFRVGGAATVLVALLFAACGSSGGGEALEGRAGTERQGSSTAAADDVSPAGGFSWAAFRPETRVYKTQSER
jgi:hypothetical protein